MLPKLFSSHILKKLMLHKRLAIPSLTNNYRLLVLIFCYWFKKQKQKNNLATIFTLEWEGIVFIAIYDSQARAEWGSGSAISLRGCSLEQFVQ
jgi:hypothetical protein